jgi:murein DD-endopeptidase MepM/ murein hydrolase activator NlpD
MLAGRFLIIVILLLSALQCEPPEPGSQPHPEPYSAPPSRPHSTPASELNPVTDSDMAYLRSRGLIIPVAGVVPGQLRDTFDEARSEGRKHDAIDIMAPQNAPVFAADDGTIARLFLSEKGGTTLYQVDPSGRYEYYYAHLARYAESVSEGKSVKRGEVIAYVGDTGNAGPGNYHLHFEISKLSAPRKWWGGTPINPYPLLKGQ